MYFYNIPCCLANLKGIGDRVLQTSTSSYALGKKINSQIAEKPILLLHPKIFEQLKFFWPYGLRTHLTGLWGKPSEYTDAKSKCNIVEVVCTAFFENSEEQKNLALLVYNIQYILIFNFFHLCTVCILFTIEIMVKYSRLDFVLILGP
ncbi:hypothetical protein KIL84_004817 [Mauremys mutica]|uniref:Uncharacterized protein n=1 Tax=Mauremys mutica TaxID=74926 RepID=A0A9D3XQF0_9SAUR|nr:hypothetical protein KIL84_004817 [Mauremys mutica]